MDVLIADAASLGRLLRTPPTYSGGLFDAMVTDPPYGVRERSCRVASEAVEKEPSLQTAEYINEITGGCVLRRYIHWIGGVWVPLCFAMLLKHELLVFFCY